MTQPPPPPQLAPPSFQNARTIVALMLREMSSTYGSSPGGYIWAILQPVGMLLILSVAFSLLVRSPSLGTSFLLFYATGLLPFTQYGQIAQKTGAALRYARALLAYPSVTWADAILGRFILNVLTSSMVFCIVMFGILMFEQHQAIIDMRPILIGLLLTSMLGLGVGLVNAVLGGLYPIWDNIWSIVSRPLFLASAIFYIYEDLPETAQNILWWNPLVHISGIVRSGFFPTYHPDYVSLPYCFGVSMVLTFFGLLFMGSQHTVVLERR